MRKVEFFSQLKLIMSHYDESISKKLEYQSFSTSYTIDKSTPYYCNCDYCTNSYFELNKPKLFSNIPEYLVLNCVKQCNLFADSLNKNFIKHKSKSLDSIDKLQRAKLETKQTADKNHLFCYYYLNLWQGEQFKARALERQNEKLETRIKELELKLDRETQQQIKISLEWRKTVTNLVDENKRLKLLQIEMNKNF